MARGGPGVRRLVVAASGGAAVAFPLGLYLGRPIAPGRPAPAVARSASVQNHYSPAILSDPFFIDQQRRVVELLEASCRSTRSHCTEARAARDRLTALENGR